MPRPSRLLRIRFAWIVASLSIALAAEAASAVGSSGDPAVEDGTWKLRRDFWSEAT